MKSVNRYTFWISIGLLVSLSLSESIGQKSHAQIELGKVEWLRDYDSALSRAVEEAKPVLILFQEVPGCATCRNYGSEVLSHPMIVEVIEHEFIPLVIYNNKGGGDRKILDLYGEPSWNNPVVRIVDASGKDIMKRLSGNYSAAGLVLNMSLALRKGGYGEPEYLSLLKEELSVEKPETSYYKMYCFWGGEAHLGNQDGVVSTEAGWMNGAEVVKVVYDGARLKEKNLTNYATEARCQPMEYHKSYKKDKDPQYYLKKSKYKYLPLLAIQKTRINSALANEKDPTVYLSPSQKIWLSEDSKDILYDQEFAAAWDQKFN